MYLSRTTRKHILNDSIHTRNGEHEIFREKINTNWNIVELFWEEWPRETEKEKRKWREGKRDGIVQSELQQRQI